MTPLRFLNIKEPAPMKTFRILVACAAIAASTPFTVNAVAQVGETTAAAEMSDGEVRKIDKENQKITLKHGEIKNLDMPGMTMVFKVKESALMDKVQVGAKVRFRAEKADGGIVVTAMEASK